MGCEGVRIETMGVDDYRAPRWPENSSLMHIDFDVQDLERAAELVLIRIPSMNRCVATSAASRSTTRTSDLGNEHRW